MRAENTSSEIQISPNFLRGYAKLRHIASGYKIYVALLPLVGGVIKYSHKAFRKASDAEQYREDVMNRYRSLKRIEIENELSAKQNSSDE